MSSPSSSTLRYGKSNVVCLTGSERLGYRVRGHGRRKRVGTRLIQSVISVERSIKFKVFLRLYDPFILKQFADSGGRRTFLYGDHDLVLVVLVLRAAAKAFAVNINPKQYHYDKCDDDQQDSERSTAFGLSFFLLAH